MPPVVVKRSTVSEISIKMIGSEINIKMNGSETEIKLSKSILLPISIKSGVSDQGGLDSALLFGT